MSLFVYFLIVIDLFITPSREPITVNMRWNEAGALFPDNAENIPVSDLDDKWWTLRRERVREGQAGISMLNYAPLVWIFPINPRLVCPHKVVAREVVDFAFPDPAAEVHGNSIQTANVSAFKRKGDQFRIAIASVCHFHAHHEVVNSRRINVQIFQGSLLYEGGQWLKDQNRLVRNLKFSARNFIRLSGTSQAAPPLAHGDKEERQANAAKDRPYDAQSIGPDGSIRGFFSGDGSAPLSAQIGAIVALSAIASIGFFHGISSEGISRRRGDILLCGSIGLFCFLIWATSPIAS